MSASGHSGHHRLHRTCPLLTRSGHGLPPVHVGVLRWPVRSSGATIRRRDFITLLSGAASELTSYGTNLAEAYRQAGVYTGRILKGEKPSELPVLLANKLEFVIKVAKTLGLTASPNFLSTADDVIEWGLHFRLLPAESFGPKQT